MLIDGATYPITRNKGAHTLHGGAKGLSRVLWRGEVLSDAEVDACLGADTHESSRGVRFRYTSAHMEEGFPSTLQCSVTYTLTHCPQTLTQPLQGHGKTGEGIKLVSDEGVGVADGEVGAALCVRFEAINEGPLSTPVNMTTHAYWNLNGDRSGQPVQNHLLKVNADRRLETDSELIPTGQIIPVDNSPLDFRYSLFT